VKRVQLGRVCEQVVYHAIEEREPVWAYNRQQGAAHTIIDPAIRREEEGLYAPNASQCGKQSGNGLEELRELSGENVKEG
jgi:hypothetical protein